MLLNPRRSLFVDPLALSFTKRGELAALKQLLFLAFIESDGAPPNYSIVADPVAYKSPETYVPNPSLEHRFVIRALEH